MLKKKNLQIFPNIFHKENPEHQHTRNCEQSCAYCEMTTKMQIKKNEKKQNKNNDESIGDNQTKNLYLKRWKRTKKIFDPTQLDKFSDC